MRIRHSTLAEMKANKCERHGCSYVPHYQIFDINADGIHESIYLCEGHYAEFKHQLAKQQEVLQCELCGKSADKLTPTPKFGDPNPNKLYQACAVCYVTQHELADEEFENEDIPDSNAADVDDRPNLDSDKYDDF